MSDERSAAIIERLVREAAGRCRFCRCAGGTCTTATGEKCELQGELQMRCTGVRCEIQYWAEKARRGRAA